MPRRPFALAAATLAVLGFALPVLADDVVLTLKDHKFDPAKLELPAGAEHKILVKNLDGTPEEFESGSLDIEKVIAGGTEASFTIGPLDPGTYEFYGEFHEDTAQGQIVVK